MSRTIPAPPIDGRGQPARAVPQLNRAAREAGTDKRKKIAMNALNEALSRERMRDLHAELQRERLASELAAERRWRSRELRARAASRRHRERARSMQWL